MKPGPSPRPVSERLRSRCEPGGEFEGTPHELWTGAVAKNGYAQITDSQGDLGGGRRAYLIHRAAWIIAHGEIPDGYDVDHRCRVRHCVAIAHLRLLPIGANRRGHGPDVNANRTHCPKGHSYDDDNTMHGTQQGGHKHRRCRVCHNEWERQRQQRLRGQRAAA